MGLDMYMSIRKYESLSSYDENFKEKVSGFYPPELQAFQQKNSERNFLSKETEYQVGYWRKANAIHNWFVENCADGKDECQPIHVNKDELQELLDTCQKVLKDHSKAEELLPTQSGFFFGSTDYDGWYFEDLQYTVELLTDILEFLSQEHPKGIYYDVVYQASW